MKAWYYQTGVDLQQNIIESAAFIGGYRRLIISRRGTPIHAGTSDLLPSEANLI